MIYKKLILLKSINLNNMLKLKYVYCIVQYIQNQTLLTDTGDKCFEFKKI